MPYKVVLAKSTVKELEKLSAKIHDKIVERLRQLEENPRVFGTEKLAARDEYKLRVGSHRIIYTIDDAMREVKVLMVEDRKQVYKRLKRRRIEKTASEIKINRINELKFFSYLIIRYKYEQTQT